MATAANWRDKLRQIEVSDPVSVSGSLAKTAKSAKSPPFGSFGTFGRPSGHAEQPTNRDAQGRLDTRWLVPAATGTPESPPSAFAESPSPAIQNPDDFEERAALVEYGAGVPREWAEGFARLDLAKPPKGFDDRRWRTLIDDGGRFLDRWGREAAQLGWTEKDVFGVHPVAPGARYDTMGLVPLIGGDDIIAISERSATIRARTSGSTLVYLRRPRAGSIALWELSRRP